MRRVIVPLGTLVLLGAMTAPAGAQDTAAAAAMHVVAADSVMFAPMEVPGFDSGMQIAVLYGNPQESGPYTLRLSFPDGYRFPPHWHPTVENLTVLSGTLLLAMGERAEAARLRAYRSGAYLYLPATRPHFGGARGATVVQLHGQGPFVINVVGQPSR